MTTSKKPRRALSSNSRPRALPTVSIAVWGLLLDKFDAPDWLWGAVGVLAATWWLASLYDLFKAEDVEL